MKDANTKPTEIKCPACNGTAGYPIVMQRAQPGRKIYLRRARNAVVRWD